MKPCYRWYFFEFHPYIRGIFENAQGRRAIHIANEVDKVKRAYEWGYLHAGYDILTLYYVLCKIHNIDYEEPLFSFKELENLDIELCFMPPNYSILSLVNKNRAMRENDDKYELFLKEFVIEISRIAIEKESFMLSRYIEDINYEYEGSYLHQYGMLVEAMVTRCDEIPKEGEEDIRYKYVYASDLGLDKGIPYIVTQDQMKNKKIS
ncbi:hypothetical protein Cyrtocomes_00599 [Candidatus Cyrtobacter comes]|uniref:Uncharacterized protein n=1 Tax=Candidatus Cyrtobacter comes TaxID=675776 RepID=A0ABU5L7Y0_9RICK|nr:hypothetical protein [Candidatus Cyrtobacter comes]MDZ5762225.1 hypothetical protein [Candidatus Cyrtobacter comes]